MSRNPREEPDKSGPAAFTQVDPQVIRQWALAIGALDLAKQLVDVSHVPVDKPSLDFEDRHLVQATEGNLARVRPVAGRKATKKTTARGTCASAKSSTPTSRKPTTKGAKKGAQTSSVRKAAARKPSKKVHDRATEVLRRLKVCYPEAVCELTHADAFQLLAATILSAQCTDARVNMVTPALFSSYPTPQKMAVADVGHVEELVRSTGFYQTKAKNLIGMAHAVATRFDGVVPHEIDDLVTLPGVGRKTANVLRSVVFNLPGLPVDTHVGRLSRRLGLTIEEDPVKVEHELNALLPPDEWGEFSLRLILHGRRVCDAKKPMCISCELADICPSSELPRAEMAQSVGSRRAKPR